jgi:hypothetical protein
MSEKTTSTPRSESYITPGHVRAFQMITSQLYDNISLTSCRINGEPGVAIVLVDHVGENKIAVMPLFVAITPGMQLEFVGEARQGSGEEGGGPKRYDVLRQHEAKSEPGGAS